MYLKRCTKRMKQTMLKLTLYLPIYHHYFPDKEAWETNMHFLLDSPYYQDIRNRAQVEKSKFIEHGRQIRNIDGKNRRKEYRRNNQK